MQGNESEKKKAETFSIESYRWSCRHVIRNFEAVCSLVYIVSEWAKWKTMEMLYVLACMHVVLPQLLRVFNEHMLLAGRKNSEPDIICILLCFRFSDLCGIVLKKKINYLKHSLSSFNIQLRYDVVILVLNGSFSY